MCCNWEACLWCMLVPGIPRYMTSLRTFVHPESVPPRRCVFFAPGYKPIRFLPDSQYRPKVLSIETL